MNYLAYLRKMTRYNPRRGGTCAEGSDMLDSWLPLFLSVDIDEYTDASQVLFTSGLLPGSSTRPFVA